MTKDEVTLKEYVLALMDRQDKAVQAALAAATTATNKAEADARRWQSNANEWRDSMNDREAKFVNNDVFRETVVGLRQELRQRSFSAVVGYVAGFIGILAAVVAVVIAVSK